MEITRYLIAYTLIKRKMTEYTNQILTAKITLIDTVHGGKVGCMAGEYVNVRKVTHPDGVVIYTAYQIIAGACYCATKTFDNGVFMPDAKDGKNASSEILKDRLYDKYKNNDK